MHSTAKGRLKQTPTLSPRQALMEAARNRDEGLISRICSKYKFTEAQCNVIKIQSYIENGMWKEFDTMTRGELPGIGWSGIANICIDLHQTDRAKKFVRLMSSCDEKFSLCERLGMYSEAIAAAKELKRSDLVSKYEKRINE